MTPMSVSNIEEVHTREITEYTDRQKQRCQESLFGKCVLKGVRVFAARVTSLTEIGNTASRINDS